MEDKLLSDGSLPQSLFQRTPAVPGNLAVPGGVVDLGAGLKVAVELFNQPEDADASGVFGSKGEAEPELPRTPIRFDQGAAWLKYVAEVGGTAKAAPGMSLPYLGVSAEGGVRLQLADYRRHPATERLEEAVAQDLGAPRFALDPRDVLAMKVGDALTLQARLQLGCSIEVSWADIFASQFNALSRLLAASELLVLEVSAGLTVSAGVGATDEFSVTFWREKPGTVVVTVKKLAGREASAGVDIGVAVKPAKTQELQALLGGLLSREPIAGLDALVQQLEAGLPSAALVQAGQSLLARFGIQVTQAPASVKEGWESLKKKLTDLAQERLRAGFAYQYGRIAEGATVLELVIPDEQLATYHPALISGKLDDDLARIPAAYFRRYFHQDSRLWKRSWGFSLGFKALDLATGKDTSQLKCVSQHTSLDHLQGPRRYSYLGARAYESGGLLAGRDGSMGVDFKADMKAFTTDPRAKDFSYGLHLLIQSKGRFDEGAIRRTLDEAIVWKVFGEEQETAAYDWIKQAAGNDMLETRLELLIDDAPFRRLLVPASSGRAGPICGALARAMPWMRLPSRASPERRQELYTELWRGYWDDQARDWNLAKARNEAWHFLKSKSDVTFANSEFERRGDFLSFADVLERNSPSPVGGVGNRPFARVFDDWKAFIGAAMRIRDAIQQNDPVPTEPADFAVAKAFRGMEGLFGNPFRMTALGAWLVALANEAGVFPAVQRTLTVTVRDAQGEKAELIFGSRTA